MKNVPTSSQCAAGKEVAENLDRLFCDRGLQDNLIWPSFNNMRAGHACYVAHFVAEAFGCPGLIRKINRSN